MALPKFVNIKEVGPREGMQFEKGPIPTADKIRLVDMLSECNFRQIEVTSFVSPKWVPQMADADDVARAFKRRPGTEYSCIFLNAKGLERAVAHGKFDIRGTLWATASNTFSKKNTNKNIEETYVDLEERVGLFTSFNIPVERVGVMAAFGCNFEGDVDQQHVISMVARLIDIAQRQDANITEHRARRHDGLGDAADHPPYARSGARPLARKADQPASARYARLGLSNAFAAMEMGVDDFDAAVGGLGGCPYGGFKGAAGNISSEDLVHMCHELGIETGIDLDKLIEAAREAEKIVGHPLPGKLIQGTPLKAYRGKLAA